MKHRKFCLIKLQDIDIELTLIVKGSRSFGETQRSEGQTFMQLQCRGSDIIIIMLEGFIYCQIKWVLFSSYNKVNLDIHWPSFLHWGIVCCFQIIRTDIKVFAAMKCISQLWRFVSAGDTECQIFIFPWE